MMVFMIKPSGWRPRASLLVSSLNSSELRQCPSGRLRSWSIWKTLSFSGESAFLDISRTAISVLRLLSEWLTKLSSNDI